MENNKFKEHESCDFGKKSFNLTKRTKKFVEEINTNAGKSSPRGKNSKPAVTGLIATVLSPNSIQLVWNALTGTTSYAVYRNGTYIASASTTNYTDTNLLSGTTYYYKVAAFNTDGSIGTFSTEIRATTTAVSNQPAVILLDFDGHTVSGTSWNASGPINAAYSGLTIDEQNAILANCREDYAPYNVIVTTDEGVYLSGNPAKRVRCIITESYEWYGSTAGGVAYTGSFTWGNDTPCWVFSSLLGYNVKNIQEAVSHEVGHTIGLRHQASYDASCNLISAYNYGCCGTAPIMGVGYDQPVVIWWIGPTSLGCNNIQDDNAILTSVLGLK